MVGDPNPSIFEAALSQAGVEARAALMVGDSLAHDVPVIRNLTDLPALL